jgi:phage shock protein E
MSSARGDEEGAVSRSYEELVAEAKRQTEQLSVEEAKREFDSGATILDVREPQEREQARIPGTRFIPLGAVEHRVAAQLPDREERIIIHCASGGRSALAAKLLQEMGYANVANMDGGINAWYQRGYEVE